ncbi:ankyrin [Xylaria cubensis]|nr:ankyrin [Xylaria cubensis]
MSAPPAPVAGPAQKRDFSLFEQHRSLLRRLYLEEGKSSAQVKKEMETHHGFPEIEAKMYEYAWRRLGLIKKLKVGEWIQVEARVKKRKEREGKGTEVFLSGVLQPPQKIHRIISRHQRSNYLQYRIDREPTPDCPDGVLLRTPPQSPNMTVTNLRNPTTQVPVVSLDVSIIDSQAGDSLDFEQLSDRVRKLMISKPDSVVHWLAHAPSSQLILAFRQHDGVEYVAFHGQESYIADPFNFTWDSAFRIPAQRHFLRVLSQHVMIFANNQKTEVTDYKRLLSWIGDDANKSVLKSFFTQDLIAMVATWAQLICLSTALESSETFRTLVEIGFTTHDGEWIQQHVVILVESTTKLGSKRVGKIARRLLSNEHVRVQARKRAAFHCQGLANRGQLDFEMISEFNLAKVAFPAKAICHLFLRSTQSPNPVENSRRLFNLLRMAGYDFDRCISDYCFIKNILQQLNILPRGLYSEVGFLLDLFCELDYLWFIAGHDIYEAIISHSTRFKTRMTIVGLTVAARGGIEQLSLYLNSRPAWDHKRQIFLELAFSIAAGLGDVAALRSFVEARIDPNAHMLLSKIDSTQADWHPLMRALTGEQWEVVPILVEMGVELRSEIKFFNPLSAAIWMMPLSNSKRLGQLEIIRYFIDKDLVNVYGADAMIKAVVPPYIEGDEKVIDAFIPDEEVVDMLLEAGIEIDKIMKNGKDILHFAIERSCNLETVELLVSRGSRIHSQPCPEDGKTMLHSAAASSSKDRQKIMELLVCSGADCTTEWGGPTILESALRITSKEPTENELSLQVFSFLLDRGAQLNGPEDRLPGAKNSYAPILTLLLRREAPDALIYKTVQAGADLNSAGLCYNHGLFTPLQYAIYRGHQAVARHLITQGADINAPAAGLFGQTALQAACDPYQRVEPSLGLIQFLLGKGADINAPGAELGATALQCAIRNGSMGAFCLLLDAGAKIFATNASWIKSHNALYTAATYGRLDMVDMILKKLARSDNQVMRLCDNAGRIAKKWGHFAIVKMLDKFVRANKA